MEIKKINDKINLDVEGQVWSPSCLTDCVEKTWDGNTSYVSGCEYEKNVSAEYTSDF